MPNKFNYGFIHLPTLILLLGIALFLLILITSLDKNALQNLTNQAQQSVQGVNTSKYK